MNKPIRVVEGNAKPFEAFWQVRNTQETGGDPEINFVGYISEYSWLGDDITPKKFKEDLYAVGKGGPVTIRMHSGGGEIFAASAIRSMLIDYPGKKTIKIDGLAASAAVAIALAGDEIKIFDTAYMMVHNPGYGLLWGYLTADMLQKFSEELVLFKEGLLNAYQVRTGLSREQLSKMLDDETWMTAQQAVELGFADEVITGGSPLKKDVKESVRNYANVPAALLNAADESQSTDSGQAPASDVDIHMQEARARLAQVGNKDVQGDSKMLRELLKARAEKVARAQQLVDTADAENRDMNEAEREEFIRLLGEGDATGEISALDAQIERIQGERDRLRAAAEKKFTEGKGPEKPSNTGASHMKRVDFEKLDAQAQAAFIKSGGKIED